LQHGEAGKDLAALRHQSEAISGALMRRQTGEVGAVPDDAAAADRLQAEDGAQEASLADAVASEQAGHRTLGRADADAAQRLAGAVEEIDILDGQHGGSMGW